MMFASELQKSLGRSSVLGVKTVWRLSTPPDLDLDLSGNSLVDSSGSGNNLTNVTLRPTPPRSNVNQQNISLLVSVVAWLPLTSPRRMSKSVYVRVFHDLELLRYVLHCASEQQL